VQIEEVDERHYGSEGERDTFVVHFFHGPSGETVAPDWDATSWSVSVIRVTDATYRAAFAEARRIAAGEVLPTLFSVSSRPRSRVVLGSCDCSVPTSTWRDSSSSPIHTRRNGRCSPSSSAATVLRTRDRGSGAQQLTDWRPGASWHRASSPSRAARDELLVL
jgi:hypothetical protein